jgi:eukaryotic-like serine/threonine-protein kinase
MSQRLLAMAADRVYEFGQFRLDASGGLLFREGERVALTPKAVEILIALVENRGSPLGREELLQRVWADTIVEEGSLTSHISLLRKALGGSADGNQFIETIPKRGYRFIAPVRLAKEAAGEAQSLPLVTAAVQELSPAREGEFAVRAMESRAEGTTTTKGTRAARWRIVVPAVLMVGTLAAVAYFYFRRPVILTEKDTIVLADFDNRTGDPTFDDTLKQALDVSLRQSPYLNVLSDAKVGATLRLMTQPAGTLLTSEIARELCQRADSKAYVRGSIASMGSQYVIGLDAVNCASGDILAREQAAAAGKEKVLDALGKAASKLRTELGESLPSVQKFDAPLSQETTPSFEALKAFGLGLKTERERGTLAALPFYQRAIELDPNFARAIESVGIAYSNFGQPERANEYLTRAFQQRDHASEREKLHITAGYYLNATGDFDKAAEALLEWKQSYERDDDAVGNLGFLYSEKGQWELAAKETQKSIQLEPDGVIAYENLMQDLLALDRYDEARKTYEDARARKLDDVSLHVNRYALAFLESDRKTMAEQAAWFADKPEFADEIFAVEQETEAYTGHLQKARELTRRAVDSAVRADNKASAAIWELEGAYREELFGEANARERAISVMKLAPESFEAAEFAAFVLAGSDDSKRAESLMQELQKRFPSRTILQSYWLPTIRAEIALGRKQPQEAINALHAAAPVELGVPFSTQDPPCLYPVYVRGEAYLAAGEGTAAAAEFRKLMDHRGITWGCATGALSRLGLARAYTLQGDTAKARASYEDFFALWKEADPDIPILKQAKAENARLR